jgi:hypothetical protein
MEVLKVVIIEQLFRIGAGQLKPFDVTTPPPGAVASYILLPVSILVFLWSLRRNKEV